MLTYKQTLQFLRFSHLQTLYHFQFLQNHIFLELFVNQSYRKQLFREAA